MHGCPVNGNGPLRNGGLGYGNSPLHGGADQRSCRNARGPILCYSVLILRVGNVSGERAGDSLRGLFGGE